MMNVHTESTPACALTGEMFGKLINLAGRRRFTSQRLVLYAVLALKPDQAALQTARECLQAFSEAHQALITSSASSPGIYCSELETLYYGPERGLTRIADFIALAERSLEALAQGRRVAAELVDHLVAAAGALLPLLNQITACYEELSRRHAQQARRQMAGLMGDIEAIARQARMVAFNAQVVAARAGSAGREFSVVAGVLSDITGEIDSLVKQAMQGA